MKKLKRILLVLVFGLFTITLTGCGASSGPEKVATKMVEKLSKGDYKNMSSIFYHEDSYFSDEAFKKLLVDKNLTIEGNKKVKVKESGTEITDENGNPTVKVKVAIDNNKIYYIDTVKIKNKWYVYDDSFYNGDIKISVPKGTTVTLDGKKLSESKEEKTDVKIKHPNSYFSVTVEDVTMNTYTIKNVLKSTYNIEVKNAKTTIKDEIGSYSKSKASSKNNYTYTSDYKDGKYVIDYLFNFSSDSENVNKFVTDYYKGIYASANSKKSWDEVKSNFDESSKNLETYKNSYEKLVSRLDGNYSDYSATDVKVLKVYDFNDTVVVALSYTFNYKYTYTYSETVKDYDSDYNAMLVLKKISNGKYVITDGKYVLSNY